MKKFTLLAVVLMSIAAAAQTTTVTGTIKDLSGTPATSGYLQFTLTPPIGQSISGSAFFTPQSTTCAINGSGLVKANDGTSPCVVTSNTSLALPGTYYQVQFCPYNACSAAIAWYAYLTTQDVSSFIPTPATSPLPWPVTLGGTGDTAAQGNGPKVQLSTGSTSIDHGVKYDANGNTVDSAKTNVGAPAITILDSSTGTYTTPASATLLHISMCGGGSGGSGAGTAAMGNGGAGGATTFGSSLLTANGGGSGAAWNPGTGGTASCGAASSCYAFQGGGADAAVYIGSGINYSAGTRGASSRFGQGGQTGINTAGVAATGSCAGGGGGSMGNSGGSGGAGGASGGFVEAWIASPASSYAYAVGAAGSAGTAGTGGNAGGAGSAGKIVIEAW